MWHSALIREPNNKKGKRVQPRNYGPSEVSYNFKLFGDMDPRFRVLKLFNS